MERFGGKGLRIGADWTFIEVVVYGADWGGFWIHGLGRIGFLLTL